MTTINDEIEMLEKRLAELKKAKVTENILRKKNDFQIVIYKEDHDIEDILKSFETFEELKEYWETSCKLKDTDRITLDFFRNNTYESYEASVADGKINHNEFEEIVKIISTLDSWQILRMELAICNKKQVLRAMASIQSEKLNEFEKLYERRYAYTKAASEQKFTGEQMTSEEYWEKVNSGKSFRLFD